MDGVDGPGLERSEKLSGRHDLVGEVEFDFQFALGGRIDGVDDRLGDMLAECGAGIGLEAPFYGRLCLDDAGCGKGCSPQRHCPGIGKELASVRHVLIPLRSEEHTSEIQSLMRISYAALRCKN